MRHAVCPGFLKDPAEQGLFAKIAPVRRIARHTRYGQDIHGEDAVADPLFGAEFGGLRRLPLRGERGAHRDGHGLFAQDIMGDLQQQGGVHPRREGHRNAAEAGEPLFQGAFFLFQLHFPLHFSAEGRSPAWIHNRSRPRSRGR